MTKKIQMPVTAQWQLSFKPVVRRKLRQGNVLGDLVMFSVICKLLCVLMESHIWRYG